MRSRGGFLLEFIYYQEMNEERRSFLLQIFIYFIFQMKVGVFIIMEYQSPNVIMESKSQCMRLFSDNGIKVPMYATLRYTPHVWDSSVVFYNWVQLLQSFTFSLNFVKLRNNFQKLITALT